tara:strand:- start:27 stop:194 length:168 start_codon:yes stop_codon:yes gene_type:complete
MTKLDENDLVEYHLFAQGAEVLGAFGILLTGLVYLGIALFGLWIGLAFIFAGLGF